MRSLARGQGLDSRGSFLSDGLDPPRPQGSPRVRVHSSVPVFLFSLYLLGKVVLYTKPASQIQQAINSGASSTVGFEKTRSSHDAFTILHLNESSNEWFITVRWETVFKKPHSGEGTVPESHPHLPSENWATVSPLLPTRAQVPLCSGEFDWVKVPGKAR